MIPLSDENPSKTIPVVNTSLIPANLCVFVYQNFFVSGGAEPLILRLGFIPYCHNSSRLLDIDSGIEWDDRVWIRNHRSYSLICSCRRVCQRACPHYHYEETQRKILSKKIATLPGACPCPINPLPQNPGTFESDHPPRSKHHIFTGLRISPPPLILLVHTEFPKPRDQNVFAICQGSLDDFREGFGHLG